MSGMRSTALPAIILVGGQGTRLRPLTERTPKPMLPLLGRPLLAYTFDQLQTVGVGRVVLACGYLPTQIEAHFNGSFDGMALEYQVEPEPRGTAGGIRFAAAGIDSTFLALNGDSLRDVDLQALLRFHRERGAKATILLTRVEDPTRYGLVKTDDRGRVVGFREKPALHEIDTDQINAGLYVLEPEVLDLIPDGQVVSIEREVFPVLAERGEVYGLALPGYWLDVGTPESYLQAHFDLLGRRGVDIHERAQVGAGVEFVGPVVVGPDAVIEKGARVGPLAHVGAGARIGPGAVVEWAVVLSKAMVAAATCVRSSIVAVEGVLTP